MKPKQKTISAWFKTVEEPHRSQLRNNTSKYLLRVKVESLSLAVKGAFAWYQSEEGEEYWREYSKKLE